MPTYQINIIDAEAARVHEEVEENLKLYRDELQKKVDGTVTGRMALKLIKKQGADIKSLFTFEWKWKTISQLELEYTLLQVKGKEIKDSVLDGDVKMLAEWGLMTIEKINKDGTKVLING